MEEINLDEFHDWILDRILVDWQFGKAIIKIHLETNCEIVILKFVSISIPRYLPWGMSQHVNSIKTNKKIDNWLMEIELQSGDVITIEGGFITVKEQV